MHRRERWKERKADRHKESVSNDNAHLADKVRIHKWIHLIFTMCSKFRFRRERLERQPNDSFRRKPFESKQTNNLTANLFRNTCIESVN